MALGEVACTCEKRKLARAHKGEPRFLITSLLHHKLLVDPIFEGFALFVGDRERGTHFLLRQYVQCIPATVVIDVPSNHRGADICTQWHVALRETSRKSCFLWLHNTARRIGECFYRKRNIIDRNLTDRCSGWFCRLTFSLRVRSGLN